MVWPGGYACEGWNSCSCIAVTMGGSGTDRSCFEDGLILQKAEPKAKETYLPGP